LGLALVSCDDGTANGSVLVGDPLIFTGTSGGKTVAVTISQTDPAKAVLTVKGGEFYEIKLPNAIVSGEKLQLMAMPGFLPLLLTHQGQKLHLARHITMTMIMTVPK